MAIPARYGRRVWRSICDILADERGYIDPGTGSMLFTILIGVVSAGVYALRNAMVKARFIMSGGRGEKVTAEAVPIVMFADSKRYWNVFEPICDELERRGLTSSYLTASPDDPALEKTYEHVTCDFIGEGNKAFAKLNMLEAGIVLSSTPGLDVYQWKRSRDVKFYAHVFHAVDDATKYRMFGIDYYDAVLLAGAFQERQIRALEEIRGLPAKELPLAGLAYMDSMKARLEAAGPVPDHDTCVLLAPSWGPSSIFNLYGGKIIEALLATGSHVIVRPHPQSFTSEADLIAGLMSSFPESDQLEWNRDNDNFEVLRRSDIMVSDYSGVVYDFALIFDRPVIYTEPAFDKGPYDAWWLDDELWMFATLPKIGRQLTMDGLGNLKEAIDECLTDPRFQAGRDQARAEGWACQGRSAIAVVDYLEAKLAELSVQQEKGKLQDNEERPANGKVQAGEKALTSRGVRVSPSENHPAPAQAQAGESHPAPAKAQASESHPAPTQVQAGESRPVATQAQASESHPAPAQAQASENHPAPAQAQAGESHPAPAQAQTPENAQSHAATTA